MLFLIVECICKIYTLDMLLIIMLSNNCRCSVQSPEYEMVDILSTAKPGSSDPQTPTQHLECDTMPQNASQNAPESSLLLW